MTKRLVDVYSKESRGDNRLMREIQSWKVLGKGRENGLEAAWIIPTLFFVLGTSGHERDYSYHSGLLWQKQGAWRGTRILLVTLEKSRGWKRIYC